jgi:predicted phosphodiesterase
MFQASGNEATLVVKTREKPTLDYALSLANVDMTVWEVEKFVCNEWEGFRKNKSVDLTFKEGVMDGEVKDNGVLVVPLWQIKVWFKRRVALQTEIPPIRPVRIRVSAGKETPPISGGFKKAFILPDMHVGFRREEDGTLTNFHDKEAIGCAYELIRQIAPDRIVVLGDLLDVSEWSEKFVRAPNEQNLTQEALNEAGRILGKLRALAPHAKIDYIEGNHSERISRLVKMMLPMAYGLRPIDCKLPALSVPHLLGLDGLGIEYHGDYPNGKVWLNENLCCIHGSIVKGRSGQTAAAVLDNSNHSVIYGHTHRSEQAHEARHHHNGIRFYTAYSPGCLCRLDGVVPGNKREQSWTQGVGLVYYEDGNRNFTIQHIPIFSGVAVFNGMRFSGKF